MPNESSSRSPLLITQMSMFVDDDISRNGVEIFNRAANKFDSSVLPYVKIRNALNSCCFRLKYNKEFRDIADGLIREACNDNEELEFNSYKDLLLEQNNDSYVDILWDLINYMANKYYFLVKEIVQIIDCCCLHPIPLFIIIISVAQLIISYLLISSGNIAWISFQPKNKVYLYPYISYILVHATKTHLFLNLFLHLIFCLVIEKIFLNSNSNANSRTSLEAKLKIKSRLLVLSIYFLSALSGSLAVGTQKDHNFNLVGSSGAYLGFMMAYFAKSLKSLRNMINNMFAFCLIIIFVSHLAGDIKRGDFSALRCHLFGGLSGFLIGLIGSNGMNFFSKTLLAVYAIFLIFLVILNFIPCL